MSMLLLQGRVSPKICFFYVAIGCARQAKYCDKMSSRHPFPFGGFGLPGITIVLKEAGSLFYKSNNTIKPQLHVETFS